MDWRLFAGLVIAVSLVACSDKPEEVALPWDENEYLRFHVPDLTANARQQDSYIIERRDPDSGDKRIVMIDAGNEEDMRDTGLSYLKAHGIKQIDELYVTHPHKDHYGGVRALLNSDIPVKRLYMNIPIEGSCNREIPWGCDYPHVLETIELAKQKGVEHEELYVDDVSKPKVLWEEIGEGHDVSGDGIRLSLLFAPRGQHPDLGAVDINDHSMIMRLEANGLSYLLVGDLNRPGGKYLAERLGSDLKADVLQAPHHGAEGAAPNEFLQAVDPKHAIVSSFMNLWCSKRSERIRSFFERNNTKARVLGMQGDVMVRHFVDSEPVWLEDRERHIACDTYWNGVFAQTATRNLLSGRDEGVLFAVDTAEMVTVVDFAAVKLSGWTFLNRPSTEEVQVNVAFLGNDQSLKLFDVKRGQRADVLDAHKDLDLVIIDPGFESLIRVDGLTDGDYAIYLVLTDGTDVHAVDTRRQLKIADGNLELTVSTKAAN